MISITPGRVLSPPLSSGPDIISGHCWRRLGSEVDKRPAPCPAKWPLDTLHILGNIESSVTNNDKKLFGTVTPRAGTAFDIGAILFWKLQQKKEEAAAMSWFIWHSAKQLRTYAGNMTVKTLEDLTSHRN